jgi:hypothetical protein
VTDTAETPTVVAGVRDSGRSRAAIRLAAQEARYRNALLLAVMAYSADGALGAPGGRPLAVLRDTDEERLVVESTLRDTVLDALGDQAQGVAVQAVPGQAVGDDTWSRASAPRRRYRRGPGMGRRTSAARAGAFSRGQAVTACLWSLLLMWMLRGLAASCTGMVRVSTPAA